MQDQTPQNLSVPQPTASKTNSILLIFAIVTLFLMGMTGFLAYQNTQLQKQLAQLQTVAPEVSPTPSPTASEVPDPTANWKTYSNTKYAFSIKYPSSFQALTNSTDLYGWPKAVVLIYSGGQSYDLPIEVWASKAEYQQKHMNTQNLKVFTTNDGKYITLVNVNNNPTVDQIISTFQFTNSNQTADTSGWKTYQINNTPYTFKYPYQLLDSGAGDWISFSSPTNKLVVGYRFLGNKSAQTLEQVIASYTEDPHGDNSPMKFQTKTSITINGIVGYKAETPDNAYYFFKETSTQKVALFMCPLGADKDLQDTCRQIISTLKFVN